MMLSPAFFSPLYCALFGCIVIIALSTYRIVYNVYFHPLRSYPGPFWAKATILWHIYHVYRADEHKAILELHEKYGPVVRVAPDEILYTNGNVWKPICGYKHNAPENGKDTAWNMKAVQGSRRDSLLFASREEHGKMRKILSQSFTDKALSEQEPVIVHYVDLLMEKLHDACFEPVNMVKWFNFTTFDIIGHLLFAESFDCLTSTEYHFWVSFFFDTVKIVTWIRALSRIDPRVVSGLLRLLPKRALEKGLMHLRASSEKLARRRQRQHQIEYTDFVSHWIAAEEKALIDPEYLEANVPLLIAAGSETTSTVLSGLMYFLGKDARVYAKLVREIRTVFATKEEINMSRLKELEYLPAVIDETLRLYHPVSTSLPRVVPPQGITLEGRYVPEGTRVGVSFYAASRSRSNFRRSEEFIPERFLGDDEWKSDRKDALQPFSYGPRNCIGKKLALVEMQLIMARLLFDFDLELLPEADGWVDQRSYAVWEKPPLMVRLRPVKGL